MRSSWASGPYEIAIAEVEEPTILDPHDVVVDIAYAAICGSDLWPYRGLVPKHAAGSTGHEFLGVVSEVGAEVVGFRIGDAVIAPFMHADGRCPECRGGLPSQCAQGGLWGRDGAGAQAERIRVPHADATLVALPWTFGELDDELARRLLPLADVFATGYHGAILAGVSPGDTVAVVGDGAVGISAAVGARKLGAARVLLLGEQEDRLRIAEGYGVETVQVTRDEPGPEQFVARHPELRVDRVVEAVGMQAAFDTALGIVRIGGSVGFVGVPHAVDPVPPMQLFGKALHLAGGTAPARVYLDRFVAETAAGQLDMSPLIDLVLPFDEIAAGYEAMHTGAALKVGLRVR
ncbi:alcohol dehydrogenase catalytic domain-containing protein [Agromyces archimandritae]|uniref:Alcohol dehydrogenase catalytic domain-containing protein n=1 Tax=Agromyces archimandritae TaxID=2781962 RepID=A0A975INM1_9MICO|nr:alcohol dehydrogenase catalytic domain-containing protein [Agromyces archimandritae]QTX04384.1 alcohol dehydrogenase catalytic domain-containing protein [Agromyces archimandritae]